MKKDKLIDFKKAMTLKYIREGSIKTNKEKEENESNSKELTLKNVELYEPVKYEDLIKLNKKRYRNLKLKLLAEHLTKCKYNLLKAIDIYKELINRTEYWEKESTYKFNFDDWNKLKKVNGHITRYLKDIIYIILKIERE